MAVDTTILTIQNDDDIIKIDAENFIKQGYSVLEATTIIGGRNLAAQTNPDIIILDITLPDGCGLDYCRDLRAHSHVPVLFKCQDGTEDEIVRCLMAGGDGCLPKPYDARLTMAKVHALLRRTRQSTQADAASLVVGPITLSAMHRRAYLNGEDMMLRPKEFALLHILLLNENKAVSPDRLYEEVWGQPLNGSRRALISCISRLRGKIERMGYGIEIERGVGYRLVR